MPAARVTDKARCDAPAPDTIRGGLLSVFFDGNPAARELDSTDQGKIREGSPNVSLGEWVPGPLTHEQAQWLYDYMSSLNNEIPFQYANDGCFARADRMNSHMESLGIPTQKIFVHVVAGHPDLIPTMNNYPGDPVAWWYHVAPAVPVADPATQSTQLMVIDPSLNLGSAVYIQDWIDAQNPASPVTYRIENANVYFVNADGSVKYDVNKLPPRMKPPNVSLSEYRADRDSMLKICSAPVHY